MDTATSFLLSVRHAIRSLARTPGFTAIVVLTLAIAIGANTAVFSAVDSILLRPLPYPEPDRLVSIQEIRGEARDRFLAPVRLEEWNAQNAAFEGITGYYTEDVSEGAGDSPSRVRWAAAAPRFFDVWRVAPALGRAFTLEDAAQRPTVVIISDRIWRTRFNADPNVLEQKIFLGDPARFGFSIVGVMPASFLFPDRDVDVWFPNFTGYTQAQNRTAPVYRGVGRLRPDVTAEEARSDLEIVQTRLGEQYPDTDRDVGINLTPLADTVVAGARGSLWLVFGAVSALLLIACTNVAALLLTRATRREHDVAIRYSLGASRRAVAGQMLMEAGVLAVAGALAGLVVALGTTSAIGRLAPELPRLDEIAIDGRILAYTAASTVLVTLLCGLFPALRHARGSESLARAGRAQISPRHSVQWLLVGVQTALSVVLLAGAGLLLRSFDELARVDAGFDPSHALAFRISGSNFEYVNSDIPARIATTLDELRAVPGVEAATTAYILPGVVGQNQAEIELTGGELESPETVSTEFRIVSPSYFDALRVPLLTGELCSERRDAGSSELMVNQSFAQRLFPGGSVTALRRTGARQDRIVGVVGDARETGTHREPVPTMYLCSSTPTATPWFIVRTTGRPEAAAGLVRAKLREIEPLRTVYELAPLEQHIGDAYAENRLRTSLLALFAGAALALTCLGIYGTLSYIVSLRRREVGLRVALGARSADIVSRFLLKALQVVGAACAAGLGLSLAFSRVLSGMLFEITATDPATLSAVVGIVAGVATAAALLPALHAARIDPMQALRED